MATIIIPTPLRKYTDQNRRFETRQTTLSGAIEQFIDEYPEVEQNLLDEEGNIRSYIKLYIGDEEVDPAENGSLELSEDTEVSIIPAIAGGMEYATQNRYEYFFTAS
ncbi:molybdopterin synthase subunit MoaD [Fodinibius roseus]|uniref:Molybdopterin synthase subunit MoaD n=1 Tax=Fodinibius roseus TaxID=1194090 RepID=A0A1M5I5L2_9BACT|nr:MoaD/ThiS family protein [Fodinibius roseus]SHG23522.1 molybdopterin synthase subunit MoaD [Fodinibius roseus]